MVDLILQFFIVFQKQTDVGLVWVSDHREIACRYARTWFVRFGRQVASASRLCIRYSAGLHYGSQMRLLAEHFDKQAIARRDAGRPRCDLARIVQQCLCFPSGKV